MKTKHVILALFAFGLAIAGAFASVLRLNEDAYIAIKSVDNESPWECVDSGVDCDLSGELPCLIVVETVTQPSPKTVNGRTFQDDDDCGDPIALHSTGAQDAEIGEVYDAQ